MRNYFNRTLFFILIATLIIVAYMFSFQRYQISGYSMGTTYHIIYRMHPIMHKLKNNEIVSQIETQLSLVNNSMSTFEPDSEISRFNSHKSMDAFAISAYFANVLATSSEIYRLSNGAWDGTINPLIELWGFYSNINRVPSDKEILIARKNVGFNKLVIQEGRILKENPDIKLDLASIAKGYGVDMIAKSLRSYKINHFVVEVGGEISVSGYSRFMKNWKVGISYPSKDVSSENIYEVINIFNQSVATSGDYRKYFLSKNNKYYSHIIDPRTGYPVNNYVASVTIIADSCVYADGLATAIMVMGVNQGMDLINKLERVEGIIIYKDETGKLVNKMSNGFEKYISHRKSNAVR